jgi:Tol biopolymer transport system component
MKSHLLKASIIVLLLLCVACSRDNHNDDNAITTPISFAGGLLDAGVRCCLSFSPDGHNLIFESGIGRQGILVQSEKIDNLWSTPVEVPFGDQQFSEGNPYYSPDGTKLYFASNRPINGSTDYNIWVMLRKGQEWGEPQPLDAAINTSDDEYGPSVTSDGTIYFNRKINGNVEIIVAIPSQNGYSSVEPLDDSINSSDADWNRYISPDGSLLMFSRSALNSESIWYSTLHNSEWSEPINLAERLGAYPIINSPAITPDGKRLVYIVMNSGQSELKEISLKALGIPNIRKHNLSPK